MLHSIKLFILSLLFIPMSSGGEQRVAELEFHESWSAEEKAALTEFHRYLRQDFSDDMWKRHLITQTDIRRHTTEHSMVTAPPISPDEFRRRIHQEIAPMLRQLANTATNGTIVEPMNSESTIRATLLAAQTGYLSAVRALVAHGADVNASQEGDSMHATPFTEVLSGCSINGRQHPWSKRKPTLEFLLSQGAELNPEGQAVLIALQLSLLAGHETEPWHWALDHGRQVTPACLDTMLTSPDGYSLVERVLREQRIDVNTNGGFRTPLHGLIYAAISCEDAEELQELQAERKLELLLSAGAKPDSHCTHGLQSYLQNEELPPNAAEILNRMLIKLQSNHHHD